MARARDRILIGLFATATFAGMYFLSFHSPIVMDCGILIDRSWRIFKGQVPYRDFYCITTPLTFLTQAWVFRIFEPKVFWMKVFLAAQMAAMTALAGFTARRLLKIEGWGLVPVLLLAMVWLPGVQLMFPWYDVDSVFWSWVCLTLIVLSFEDPALLWLLFAAGAAGALSFAAKQNVGGAALIAGAWVTAVQPRDWRSRLQNLVLFCAGAFVTLALFGWYFYKNAAWAQMVDWVFVRSRDRLGGSSAFQETLISLRKIFFGRANHFLKFLLIFYLWAFASVWKDRREEGQAGPARFAVVLYALVVIGFSVLQDGGLRYPIFQSFLGYLMGILLYKQWDRSIAAPENLRNPKLVLLLAAGLGMAGWSFVVRWRQAPFTQISGTLEHPRMKGFYLRPEDCERVQGLLDWESKIPKDEPIFVFPDPLFFYFATDRLSPVPMVPFLGFSWDLKPEERREIPAYLERAGVVWAVVGRETYYDTGFLRFDEPGSWRQAVKRQRAMVSRGDFSLLRTYLNSHFSEIAGTRGFWVLKRNRLPSSSKMEPGREAAGSPDR